jgi:hypothetical protein
MGSAMKLLLVALRPEQSTAFGGERQPSALPIQILLLGWTE